MNLKKFAKVLIAFVVGLILIVLLVWYGGSQLYLWTENRNFAALRKKSALDCQSMPVHCAVRDKDLQRLRSLIDAGPKESLNSVDGWNSTPLIYAVANSPTMVAPLLEAKADVNHVNEQGDDALAVALRFKNFEIAQALIDRGADPNLLTGLTHAKRLNRLGAAAIAKDHVLVEFLLRNGASREIKDEFGYNFCERIKLHGYEQEFPECR